MTDVGQGRDGNAHNISGNDEQMKWAIEKARLTVGYFRESLLNPKEDQYGFSLKVKLEDDYGIEHIWMNDLSVDDDGIFYGVIDGDPVTVKSVKAGSKIGIDIDHISDWIIIEEGRLIGGYTVRVYRESLPQNERGAFDQGMGIIIDFGIDYFPHDMSTPEGAILCLEDAYSEGNVEAALGCKDFRTEARMILGQVPNIGELDDDLIDSTAETLRLAFEAHIRSGDLPDFSAVKRAFPEREFVDKDTVVVSEVCMHPDGRMSLDRLIVTRFGEEWRVGPPVNDDGEEEEVNE